MADKQKKQTPCAYLVGRKFSGSRLLATRFVAKMKLSLVSRGGVVKHNRAEPS
jgi:hypothetical protein